MVEDIFVYIAIYGAVISTIALLWNIYRNFMDKPRLKVTIAPGLITHGRNVSDTQILFGISNIGKRPVTINSAGLDLKNKQQVIFTFNTGLPVKLNESNSHAFHLSLDDFKSDINKHIPTHFWVKDTGNRKYKCSTKAISKIIA